MKKLLILTVFLASISLCFSQNVETKLKNDFEQIISFTKNNEMQKVIEMTYPPFVNLLPEGGMAALASTMLEGMGIKTMYEDVPINLRTTPVIELKNAVVCMAEYDANSVLEFTDKNMVDMFTMFSPEGYKIEKIEDNKVRMTVKGYLLAIKDEHTKGAWKYLNYDESIVNSNVSDNFLSDEIVEGAIKLKKALTEKE